MIKTTLLTIALTLTLVSCGGSGGGGGKGGGGGHGGGSGGSGSGSGGGTTSTYGLYSSTSISGQVFVNALNDLDGVDLNELMVDEYSTVRSQVEGESLWFVIWDDGIEQYVSIDLFELREVQYYAYKRNDVNLAAEYASYVSDDYDNELYDGDGVLYNIVDPFIGVDGQEYYEDIDGWIYNEQAKTTDVNLMASKQENKKLFHRASALSLTYSINHEAAIRLAKLGTKVEGMVKEGSLSLSNLNELSADIQGMTGISVGDMLRAAVDKDLRAELIKKVADDAGTTPKVIEKELLPELFGVEL